MQELGALLATVLLHPPNNNNNNHISPTTICLSGDLGTGKTVLARGFLQTATGQPNLRVTSPTFLLAQKYNLPHNAQVP